MDLQILRKQLDESVTCPLCNAAMNWVDAELYSNEINFHECTYCEHRVFEESVRLNCHCPQCTEQRKKETQTAKLQESERYSKKNKNFSTHDDVVQNLEKIKFIHKLFLLSILDDYAKEEVAHDELIHWKDIKFSSITPNYFLQKDLLKDLVKNGILKLKNGEDETYYLNIRLDGYAEPSLFSVTQQLRSWFYKDLTLGVPFKTTEEVKNTLYLVLYEELVQFMQAYCRPWKVQIAGNRNFQIFCYRLMESMAVGQIYYLIQTALEYLKKEEVLVEKNDGYINTNRLKKTLEQYRERSVSEKWETPTLSRPMNLPFSKMSQILLYRFLGYNEKVFVQPVWKSWKRIEPRLSFYAIKRCMYCGSNDLTVNYDAQEYVSLECSVCKHQDHYFLK